jgi:hypothetical protein
VSDRRAGAWLIALLLITALVELPLLGGDFVWDDQVLVVRNVLTDDVANLPRFFAVDLWSTVDAHGQEGTPYYRPMMLVELLIDRTLFGLSPLAHRLHSLLWHLLCVGLVWRFLRGWRDDAVSATAAAALFALHPLHLELTAFVAARNDAMAAAGVLGALILLEGRRAGPGRLLGAGACALYALLSKESAALLPGLLLVVDLARWGRPGQLARYGALLGAGAIWAGLRSRVALADMQGGALSGALAGAPAALAFYARQLFNPLVYDPTAYVDSVSPAWWALAALAGLVGLLAARGGRAALAGLGLAGLTFAPALVGVHFAEMYAHRYVYLPLAGLALMVHAALAGRLSGRGRWVALGAAVGLALATLRAEPVWASTRTFWEHVYARYPDSRTACPLFVEYTLSGEDGLAEPMLRAALAGEVHPHCCYWPSRWYLERGRPELARSAGEQALEGGCGASGELVMPIAMAEALMGEWDAAEARAAGVSRDPYGYRALILSAAALRRGDRTVLEGFSGQEVPEGTPPLEAQVEALLGRSP